MVFFLCGAASLWLPAQLAAQDLGNQQRRTLLPPHAPRLLLDSLSVATGTLRLRTAAGAALPDSLYRLEDKVLVWENTPPPDTLWLEYRRLPLALGQVRQRLDTTYIRADDLDLAAGLAADFDPYARQQGAAELFNSQGVNYRGSYSRGLSFGNSQNLVLNSALNLQMQGQLGDGIELLAAITDQNIPIQPEGNTQRLQEFDRVFIQLARGPTRLIAGDYELARPAGYFMNYFKKLQGGTLSHSEALWGGTLQQQASAAIARGKFARQTLASSEGNQGPYRLFGNAGERFIIVLAGTEKVFLDGRLLQRGIENDYVIDYNRGEIAFTNKILVTKDVRFIVEFEYSDQNYVRSLLAYQAQYSRQAWSLRFNAYSEQDGLSGGVQQSLSDAQRQALAQVGDNIEAAFASGVDTLEAFTRDRITYEYADTSVAGQVYRILRYATNPETALYTARFSEVGQGQGNYVLLQTAANGRVYGWVAPLGGQPQGSYEPIVKLVAPNQRQMFALGGQVKTSAQGSVDLELALSGNDLNRFSPLDAADDYGYALQAGWKDVFALGKNKATSPWRLRSSLQYEYVQRDFRALNPYRSAEFVRDWNAASLNPLANEHLGQVRLALEQNSGGLLEYGLGFYEQAGRYTGFKHDGRWRWRFGRFHVDAQGSWLLTAEAEGRSSFLRPRAELYQFLDKKQHWRIGLYGEQERNARRAPDSDTLTPLSLYYDILRGYARYEGKAALQMALQVQRRWDYAPVRAAFVGNAVADELNLNGQWQQGTASQLAWNLSYRDLRILDSTLIAQRAQRSYLGRVEHNLNLWRGALRSSTTYDLGSGQEPQQEFVYQLVNAGEGLYVWIDRNADSLQQWGEFELSPFPDQANYVRVTTFTNNFIQTNTVQLNQSLTLNPKALWYQDKKGLKAWLARFSTQSNWQITRKSQQREGVSPWNPFQVNISDLALVSLNSNMRNTLFFNRADPKFDAQVGMNDTRSRVVLTTGYEARRLSSYFWRSRYNISRQLSAELQVENGRRDNDSEFFANRDYQIAYWTAAPKLTWLASAQFRSELSYQWRDSRNILPEGQAERAAQHELSLELAYNRASSSVLRSSLRYVGIAYAGERNTPVEFALLNGLQPGSNYLWNCTLDRRLSGNVLLSISYEGRRTGELRTVHTGRAQVRASF